MKKIKLITLSFITVFLMFVQTSPLEARHHKRHAHVQVGTRSGYAPTSQTTVVRRYAVPVAVPMYPSPVYYVPGYPIPEYMYVTPAHPGYIEEIYTVQQRPRPFDFTGLSFSLNFFKH
jgi:hypothetical protein